MNRRVCGPLPLYLLDWIGRWADEGGCGWPYSTMGPPRASFSSCGFPKITQWCRSCHLQVPKWHNCQCSQVWMWAGGAAARGPSWVCGWPLNTPVNFSSSVHTATGGATGARSALNRAAGGPPNCPVKGVLYLPKSHKVKTKKTRESNTATHKRFAGRLTFWLHKSRTAF